jgi:hypothetical protein
MVTDAVVVVGPLNALPPPPQAASTAKAVVERTSNNFLFDMFEPPVLRGSGLIADET